MKIPWYTLLPFKKSFKFLKKFNDILLTTGGKMTYHKSCKKAWFKFLALMLVQSFLFTSAGLASTDLNTQRSCLAPTINIQSGSVSSSIAQAIKETGIRSGDGVSEVKPLATGYITYTRYLSEMNRLKSSGYISEFNDVERADLRRQLTDNQKKVYLDAIKQVLKERGEKVITPDILFEAAKRATKDDYSTVKARVGLQPGTMNPLHYGHMTASLAGIIGRVHKTDKNVKVMTLLANGGTVPDKPFAASADIRNEMAREACKDPSFKEWSEVTPIRGQIVDMFTASAEIMALSGLNENSRRFNMDMAAFIWLFVANPNVEWVYLVGSDKVDAYGKKDERGLLLETLNRTDAHASVVYFPR
ncbi:MAG: hypothetical protein Q7U74_03945, partial [Saprospiraceae bacterium]|nr:hypothetical protein [Saprospiraceae bacterium]